jgi:hypothetical protein
MTASVDCRPVFELADENETMPKEALCSQVGGPAVAAAALTDDLLEELQRKFGSQQREGGEEVGKEVGKGLGLFGGRHGSE